MSTTTAPDLTTVRVRSSNSLEEAVAHLGELKSHQNGLVSDRDRRIAEIKAEYTTEIDALDTAITRQMDGIGRYVDTAREALFGKKKSVQLAAGKVAVQSAKTTAKIEKEDKDKVIAALKGRRGKIAACLKTKYEPVLGELAKQQPAIEGVTYITSRERILITPTNLGAVISSDLNPDG